MSVRTWNEHIGKISGYNYIGPAGRIAGDVWGNCGTDAYHMQHYRNLDNTMRPYPEIAANWEEAGITADKWVAFYCGTGWRASETWLYAFLMGWRTSRSTTAAGGNGASTPPKPDRNGAARATSVTGSRFPTREPGRHRRPGRSSRRTKRATSRPRCIPVPATAEQGGRCLFRHLRERHRRRLTSSLRM